MATVKIYGASDDLVEIEGDIREEYGCYDRPCDLVFDDGTALRVQYCPKHHPNGWAILMTKLGKSKVTISDEVDPDDGFVNHVAVVDGPFTAICENVDIERAIEQLVGSPELWNDNLSNEEILAFYTSVFAVRLDTPSEPPK